MNLLYHVSPPFHAGTVNVWVVPDLGIPDAEEGPGICPLGRFEALEFVLGGFLSRGSRFDHLGTLQAASVRARIRGRYFMEVCLVLGGGKVKVLGDDTLANPV